ncbi:MAG TPA: ParB/RepB/Spo0J family partition protein, partial [Sphingobium sp.]|nr:ParB/RepB/Spo0J family partition protein [Sphingobium sp.]
MSFTTMTIDALCVSPYNVRQNQHDANAVESMAESLLKRGQLLPLVVHPIAGKRGQKKKWGALAGGRRLRAFSALIDQGRLPADHPIEVVIRDGMSEAELVELSLAENLVRVDLRPYEVYAAVARALHRGRSPKEIADTNGQTVETVRRWARLGNLHPTVFAALEAGEISQDQAKAFGATEDVALQLLVFEKLAQYEIGDWRRSAAEIRKLLKVGDRELEKQLLFVGEQAYRDAGGRYELDLYADEAEQRGRVADEGLLLQLADEKLEAIRKRVRRHVGRDLRFEPAPPRLMLGNYDQGIDNSLEITAVPRPANAADAAALAWATYEMSYLEAWAEAALNDDDLTDDIREHCIAAIDEEYEPLEDMLAELQDRMEIPLPDGQVYATLQVMQDGDTELRFWWPDRKAKQKAEAALRKGNAQQDAPLVSAGPIGKPTSPAPAAADRRSLAGSGIAIARDSGSSGRLVADAEIRNEHGLTADGIQAMRSMRREMLRAALVVSAAENSPDGVALDYLLWSLARDRLNEVGSFQPGTYSHERG